MRGRKAREEQPNHVRRRVDHPPGAVTDEREPVILVLAGSRRKTRAHRILRNVGESTLKLTQTSDNKTFEAIIPHVAVDPEVAIESHGEATEDPLHDPRERLPIVWSNHQVKVILHDADVCDGEAEL